MVSAPVGPVNTGKQGPGLARGERTMASLKEQFEAGKLEVSIGGDTVELTMPDWLRAGSLEEMTQAVAECSGWDQEKATGFVLAQARQNLATGLRAAYKGNLEARERAREKGKPVPAELDTADWFPAGFGKRTRTAKEKVADSLSDLIKSGKVSPDDLMEMIKKAAGK